MSKLEWKVIHECDLDDGTPTQWCAKINHSKYGKFCWINDMGDCFEIEVQWGDFIVLKECKSLASAKRWVAMNLI